MNAPEKQPLGLTYDRYYFPLLFLRPVGEWEPVEDGAFVVARRLWRSRIFDPSSMGRLHLPTQLVDMMLPRCDIEVGITADSLEAATDLLETFLIGLYAQGVSPTIAPFATTCPMNDYAGMRDEAVSDGGQATETERLVENAARMEVWSVNPSLTCHVVSEHAAVDLERIHKAVANSTAWRLLEERHPALRAVRAAAHAAPLLASTDQSLLHVWCALESLFPGVTTEVSFRLGLYLAQLSGAAQRAEYFKRVKKAYDVRSRVAHGSKRNLTFEEWHQAWSILMTAVSALLQRNALPADELLLAELLSAEAGRES